MKTYFLNGRLVLYHQAVYSSILFLFFMPNFNDQYKGKQIQSQTANSHRYQYAKRHTVIIFQ